MKNERFRWSYLAHLGYNMWADPVVDKWGVPGIPQELTEVCAQDTLRFDRDMFREEMKKLADAGCDTLILDLGEGVRYESHPEISSKTAFSKEELQTEIRLLKDWGIEAIPKLNFSACHDEWMGEYGRMLSTTPYYRFCEDILAEVCELFDNPPLFHLGMDEETPGHQARYNMMIVRQGELWWHDFNFLRDILLRRGVRPWIWSDYVWNHEEEFLSKMSKDVMQTNWYYDLFEGQDNGYIRAYDVLDQNGFDQIPAASVWSHEESFEQTVRALAPKLDPAHLCGFMQTVWRPMTETHRGQQDKGCATFARAKAWFDSQK